MNKHTRAVLIVAGLAVLIIVAVMSYSGRFSVKQDIAEGEPSNVIKLKEVLPGFDTKTIAGVPLSLSQFKGKVVVVNFWASWCGPCIEEVPSLIKLMKAFPEDVVLIAISGDSNMADVDSFLKSFPEMKTQKNIHIVWDDGKVLSQKYQIYRLPESYVLDKELKLVKKISGTIDWHTEDAIAYMKQLITPAADEGAQGTKNK